MKTKLIETSDVVRILGGKGEVWAFAKFYEVNAGGLLKFTTNALNEFCINNSFTKEEFEAYRAGLGEFGNFLQACLDERERELRKDFGEDSPKAN